MEDKIEWIIILLFVLALVVYAMMTLGAKPAEQQAAPPAYSAVLSLSANPSYSNAPLVVSATLTNCGDANATLRIDGSPLDYQQDGAGESAARVELAATVHPAAGTHRLSLESGQCRDSISFETLPPACRDGETRACDAGRGCPGNQTCKNNFWGPCNGPPRACNPGQRVPCAINNCVFGLTVCNACGTGWSTCTPPS